ncbi:MAG: type II toxin-antitoxin system Phd/YefM family antitoxin [Gammaproteobacteria bacterium]|nr:type II toxin-antitoxin system Phd/YefM family antitoxin [Gammaproteobacteria bacterium]
MKTVGAFEAKTHLSSLLDEVAKGEEITITRHGTPVAKLVSASLQAKPDIEKVIEELRAFSKGNRLDGLTIREMIEEGRRY